MVRVVKVANEIGVDVHHHTHHSASGEAIHQGCQPSVVCFGESSCLIAAKSIEAGWIKEYEIVLFCGFAGGFEVTVQKYCFLQQAADIPKIFRFADFELVFLSGWNIEFASPVFSVESVITGFIKENKQCGRENGKFFIPDRLIEAVPHRVVETVFLFTVRLGIEGILQSLQFLNQFIG